MRYRVEFFDGDEILDSIDDVLDRCIHDSYHEDDDYFEEWVNDNYDRVTINGETYYPYDILHEMDYSNLSDLKDCYCQNENETDADNARYELEHAHPGDEVYVQGYTVYVINDEEKIEEQEETSECSLETLRSKLQEIEAMRKQAAEEIEKEEYDLLQIIGG